MKFHALHQLFCQRQYLVLCSQDVVNGYAAGNLLKVQKLHFQRQCAPFKVILLDTPDQLQHRVIQVDGDGSVLADVRLKRLLTADGLALPLRDNRSVVDPSREVIEYLAHLTELLRQPGE